MDLNSFNVLLGGNVTSEHCGRCTQIKTFTANDTKNNPLGTCRPATALLESHKTLNEFKSIGCNNRVLERLFIFGGYSPSKRICSNQLYSLKFSSQPCKISNHKCNFSKTSIIDQTINNNNNNNIINDDDKEQQQQQENNRLCNVTPMRVNRRSHIPSLPSLPSIPSTKNKKNKMAKPITIKRSNIKSKRVSIVQTPVRVKSLLSTNINAFSRFESVAANQK